MFLIMDNNVTFTYPRILLNEKSRSFVGTIFEERILVLAN